MELDVEEELEALDKLDPCEKLLSRRGKLACNWEDFLLHYLDLCNKDPFDETTNPMGFVNLGTSVNNLCNDIIYPKLTSNEVWSCDPSLLQYSECYGIKRLREAFAKLMTKFLESHLPVSPNDILFFTGVTSCIDTLAHCLADPGDVFLVPTPMYGRIYTDFKQRALVDVWPIPIITVNNTEDFPALTLEKVVDAYQNAVAKGRIVRGIFLINPSNPLGDIYSPKLLMDILMFCNAKSLHIVVDEVYALSVFSNSEKFHSVLKFCYVPDPKRIHVLYGLSKDFAIAGLRIGLIHTKCELLKKSLIQLSFFQNVPFPVMQIVARYLEDIAKSGLSVSGLMRFYFILQSNVNSTLEQDFGIAGLRIGAIHTKCKPLKQSLMQLSNFQNIPFPVMDITARFLEDIDWCKSYIKTNQQRITEKFEFCRNYLKSLGLKVIDSRAGFFVWVNLHHVCGSSFEEERRFFNYLIEKAHLYIVPGKEFFCDQPGWFRIVFTGNPHHLKEGLKRLERELKLYK